MADAFTTPDRNVTATDRERDRGRMGDLYRRAKGSEAGLGELVLEAYDRNVTVVHTRELRLRGADPNAQLSDPMQFTLTGVDGAKLPLATLRGKVLIFDFWATWCVPCREQHPLYEQVKQRFRNDARVVFLSVSTDEDHAAVHPFLNEVKWASPAYFEDGLSRAFDIRSIPTTIIMDRHGKVFSRLIGFESRRFVEMLSERIRDALVE